MRKAASGGDADSIRCKVEAGGGLGRDFGSQLHGFFPEKTAPREGSSDSFGTADGGNIVSFGVPLLPWLAASQISMASFSG